MKYDPKRAFVKFSLLSVQQLSALNRHHSYRQVHVAPWWSHWLPSNTRLATLAPPVPHLLWFWLKTQREKCDEEMKQTRLFRTNYWARLCCATNHQTYSRYKENQIIMRLKNFIMAHLCGYLMTNLSSDVLYGSNDQPCVMVMTTKATTEMTTAVLLS